jgi:hypothetical protein
LNVIAGGEGPILYVLYQIFRVLQNPHLIHTTSLGNRTYTPTTLTKEEILDNHMSVLCSFGISTKDEELESTITLLRKAVIGIVVQQGSC